MLALKIPRLAVADSSARPHHRPDLQERKNAHHGSENRAATADWHTETTAVHAGEFIDPATRASSPNLVMSVTFAPEAVTGFSARDEQDYEGYVYGRVGSPTVAQLEAKLAALEGAEAALCFASGVAAAHALICGRLSRGDHLIVPDANYVGIAELARDTLPRFGIEVSYVDVSRPEEVAAAIRPNTRMLWLETPANPTMKLCDIALLARLAHDRGRARRGGRFHLCHPDRDAAPGSLGRISWCIRSPNISAAMAMRWAAP